MKEKLVPLDISDAIALIERQEQEIAALTAENSVLREQNFAMNASLVKLRPENEKLKERYDELIMQVERKFPNESRHETAKRYIRERESTTGLHIGQDALKQTEGGET